MGFAVAQRADCRVCDGAEVVRKANREIWVSLYLPTRGGQRGKINISTKLFSHVRHKTRHWPLLNVSKSAKFLPLCRSNVVELKQLVCKIARQFTPGCRG